jgi:hypothetical protein
MLGHNLRAGERGPKTNPCVYWFVTMESNFETSYLLTRKRLGSRSPFRPNNLLEAFPIKAGDDPGVVRLHSTVPCFASTLGRAMIRQLVPRRLPFQIGKSVIYQLLR